MSGATFIAEVSSNHHRDLDRCFAFIDRAAQIGCAAVKFQLFRIDQLFAPEILAKSEKHRQRRDWELPEAFIPELATRCRQQGIAFSCTPFYLDAVALLAPHVAFFKVASYELLWHDLLRACAATGKPVVLSTGMATLDEIAAAVRCLHAAGCRELTLLHCVSGYPTPVADCNLAAIATLRNDFGWPVGWSDHSVDPAVVCRAVHHFGASVVEFHLDLDGKGEEFQTGHCWLPEQIAPIIRACRAIDAADGDGIKQPTAAERPDRPWRADPEDGLRPRKEIRDDWHP